VCCIVESCDTVEGKICCTLDIWCIVDVAVWCGADIEIDGFEVDVPDVMSALDEYDEITCDVDDCVCCPASELLCCPASELLCCCGSCSPGYLKFQKVKWVWLAK